LMAPRARFGLSRREIAWSSDTGDVLPYVGTEDTVKRKTVGRVLRRNALTALAMTKAVGRTGRVIALEPNLSVPADQAGSDLEPLATPEHRYDNNCRTFEVRCPRLDNLVGGSRPVSLVKIDVEGHEADVLEGASELLERDRPALAVEIEQRHLVGRSVADVVEWVMERGASWSHGRSVVFGRVKKTRTKNQLW
jgi:hypothetical protein